ncbi:MAG: hypothetical protein H8D22_06455 [Candidatus Cloacimonetes bacterium]|nr:hypothetical protein [Candidatus Cloacimonadota bacterium]
MKKILMVSVTLAVLAGSLFAGSDEEFDYIDGNVIIQTSDYMEVLQREPELVTDKEWFNEMIPIYDITDVRQIGEKIIPAENLTNFLFYTVVFDTVHTVQEVQDVFAMSLYHISCAGEYDKDSDYESKKLKEVKMILKLPI